MAHGVDVPDRGIVGRNVGHRPANGDRLGRVRIVGWTERRSRPSRLAATFSNDGTHLSFLGQRARSNTGWLVVADADGAHPRRLESPLDRLGTALLDALTIDRSSAVTGRAGRGDRPRGEPLASWWSASTARSRRRVIPTPHRSAFPRARGNASPFAGPDYRTK